MSDVNDLVLIYFEDKPLSFARIEEILPDSKPDWYHVKLLMLQIPPQYVTWILRDVYINGEEFTMNEKREDPRPPEDNDDEEKKVDSRDKSGKAEVISFKDLKKP
jgi:hypothetical protein